MSEQAPEAPAVKFDRKSYVEALKVERQVLAGRVYPGADGEATKTRRLGEVDAEIDRYSDAPAKRGAPEKG